MIKPVFGLKWLLLFLILAFPLPLITAQDCAAVIADILRKAMAQCTPLDDNTVCYGYPLLEATLNTVESFNTAGARIPVSSLQSIRAAALSLSSGTWGVLMMQLRPLEAAGAVRVLVTGQAELRLLSSPDNLHVRLSSERVCPEASAMLALYVPPDATFTWIINTRRIEMQGLVIFQSQNQNSLTASVVQGNLTVEDGQSAVTGQTIAFVTANDGTILFGSAARSASEPENQATRIITPALEQSGITVIATCTTTHVVAEGENLFRIALRYNQSLDALAAANGISDPAQIVVGQTLTVPCTGEAQAAAPPAPPVTQVAAGCNGQVIVHTVVDGENLFRIARRYGTTVDAIAAANNFSSIHQTIFHGQQLVIPCGHDTGISSQAASSP